MPGGFRQVDRTSGGAAPAGAPVIVEVSTNYSITVDDDYVASTGSNTLTLPLLASAVRPVTLKSVTGTDTIDGNGASVENGLSVTPSQSRKLLPVSTGWVEIT